MADMSKVKKYLNGVISSSLYDPGGDPIDENLWSAAYAFAALYEFGLDVDDRDDVEISLRGENVCEHDFLSWVQNDATERFDEGMDEYVYIRIKRPEGYEEVHPQLILEDAIDRGIWEAELVQSPLTRVGKSDE